jgi:hypothetical protein
MDHDNTNSDKKSLMSYIGKIFGANHLFHGTVKTLLKTHLGVSKNFKTMCIHSTSIYMYIVTQLKGQTSSRKII